MEGYVSIYDKYLGKLIETIRRMRGSACRTRYNEYNGYLADKVCIYADFLRDMGHQVVLYLDLNEYNNIITDKVTINGVDYNFKED